MNRLLRKATRFAVPKLMNGTRKAPSAAMVKAARWAIGRVKPEPPKRTSPATLIARGLGVAAATLPLGLWIGKMIRGRGA